MIVTTRDLFTIRGYSKRRGFCRSGARDWFRAHGLDWKNFVKSGIADTALDATGDALGMALAAWARQRAGDATHDHEDRS